MHHHYLLLLVLISLIEFSQGRRVLKGILGDDGPPVTSSPTIAPTTLQPTTVSPTTPGFIYPSASPTKPTKSPSSSPTLLTAKTAPDRTNVVAGVASSLGIAGLAGAIFYMRRRKMKNTLMHSSSSNNYGNTNVNTNMFTSQGNSSVPPPMMMQDPSLTNANKFTATEQPQGSAYRFEKFIPFTSQDFSRMSLFRSMTPVQQQQQQMPSSVSDGSYNSANTNPPPRTAYQEREMGFPQQQQQPFPYGAGGYNNGTGNFGKNYVSYPLH